MSSSNAVQVLSKLKLDLSGSEQLHLQIQRRIHESIQTHQLTPGEKLPTNFEIAQSLNVGYVTVQRAMRSLANQGVIERRKSKGTFVRQAVKPLVVGIFCTETVFDPVASTFSSLMVHHLTHSLHADARDLRLYYVPESQNGKVKAYHDLWRDIDNHRLAGVVAINRMPTELTALARDKSFPLVGVVVDEAMANTVWIDLADFCRRAIAGLMKEGCRRIVLVGFSTGIERTSVQNLLRIAAGEGLEMAAEDVKTYEGTYQGDWRDLGVLMARTINLSEYDGVVLADDILAVGFTRELAQRGVRTPQDIQLATTWNQNSPHSLSLDAMRFEVNAKRLAQRSVEMLDDLIDNRPVEHPHVYMKLEQPGD
ncbi:MAG: GntR family transcriptional regulator [Phycisphaerales bacterium]|nr:GntR family transcriptional regulator [Phycisphaerales bacterium]